MNKPFETYPGGKNADGVYQNIISNIPPHDIYIELFLGNGAILRHKLAAKWNIGIDISTKVVSEWLAIIDSFSTKNIQILVGNSIEFVKNFWVLASILKNLGLRIFLFADPTYLMDSRKSDRPIYENELTETDHIELLSGLNRLSPFCNILVTHYEHALYNQMLSGWNTQQFSGQTRQGRVIDTMYMNYPSPTQLHDYRYLGTDYRDRERIKGIITRNTDKFKRMPDIERQALIENLKKENLI